MAEVKSYQDRRVWLLQEIHSEKSVDVLHSDFVNAYADFSGAAMRVAFWGAGWCPLLSADLRRMFKAGLLRRAATGMSGNWQPGFPKWVYSYRLSAAGQDALAEAQAKREGERNG
jgi:hypothetical protein